VQAVLNDFEAARSGPQGQTFAGKDFAAQVLEQAVGQEKAAEMLRRSPNPDRGRPFETLWELEADRIAGLLSSEHPQVTALVLTYLPPEKAALVLSVLDESLQPVVAARICAMGDIDPEVIDAIEEVLHASASAKTRSQVVAAPAGPKVLAEILNNTLRSTERTVLDSLLRDNPDLGQEVRGMMFLFEDLNRLDDRMVQIVLREVDQEDLRLALKGADDEIKELVFRNMSERAAETLKEDLELAGHVRTKDFEAAQQRIAGVVKQLLASGKIELHTDDEETTE
jgi:flagellar motor switch protein FliG